MHFLELQARLVDLLRHSVRDGDVTERGLARLAGVSQPHLHQVLKGGRALSNDMADRLLRRLGLSVLDLLPSALGGEPGGAQQLVRVITQPLVPGQPWAGTSIGVPLVPLPPGVAEGVDLPFLVWLAPDRAMGPDLSGGRWAVLDRSLPARARIDPEGLYVAEMDSGVAVRWVSRCGTHVAVFSREARERPDRAVRLPLAGCPLLGVIRARIHLLPEGSLDGFDYGREVRAS